MATVYPSHPPDAFSALAPPSTREIAGFWRRFGAFVIDTIIVGVGAFIITIPFFGPLSKLGSYGPIVGLLIALPYFAILNSRIGHGQTVGKRVLHIQVVDASGATLSFNKSLVRYLVLAAPFYLGEVVLPARTPWIISTAWSGLGVVTAATFYFVLFNRHTRQGMHDLAVGSFVASSDLAGAPKQESIWKPHWAIFASLVILIFVGERLLGKKIGTWGAFQQLAEDARLVENLEGVQTAQVMEQWSATLGDERKKKTLVITVRWIGDSSNQEAAADNIAKTILLNDSALKDFDYLNVVLVRGYDIGITHAKSSRSFAHSLDKWRARLFPTVNQASPTKL